VSSASVAQFCGVDADKQWLAAPENDGRNREMQLIDEAGA
jgi:hypothetical protein